MSLLKKALGSGVAFLLLLFVSTQADDFGNGNNIDSVGGRRLNTYQDTFLPREVVRTGLRMSMMIYRLEPGVDVSTGNRFRGHNVRLFAENSEGTEVMVLENLETGLVYVVFRGSEEGDDWWTNLDVGLDSCLFEGAPNNALVHSGFQDALYDEGIVYDVENVVTAIVGTDGEVFITGHSLGAAMAMMMSAYLANKYPNMMVTMASFAGPRTGNGGFKDWVEDMPNLALWRWTNDDDPVVRIPTNLQGFKHAGHTFHIGRQEDSIVYYRHTGSEVYAPAPSNWYYGVNVFDHYASEYGKVIFKDKEKYWPTDFTTEYDCPWYNPLCWTTGQ